MKSFEAEPDVFEMLQAAETAPGFNFRVLCNEALRRYGPEEIRRMLEEQRKTCDTAIASLNKIAGKRKKWSERRDSNPRHSPWQNETHLPPS